MRKILITLLLASAAASPALASPRDFSDRQQARQDRQEARAESRADRSADRPSYSPPAQSDHFQAPHQQAVERPQYTRPERAQPQVDANVMRAQRDASRDAFAAQRNQRVEQIQQRFDQRQQDMRDNRDLRQSTRSTANVTRDRNPPVVSDTPRPGTQPPLSAEAYRHTPAQWSTSWRNSQRYDWQDYRRHHRSTFHLGFYYDPFGWGYQPYMVGWRMWPSYYGSQFWLDDPWEYRLPYAPMGTRWVRYWDDAVLVDTWSGQVVDVIYNFFW